MLEIDLILVVGKTKPVRIFFLLGDEGVRATSAFATLESAHDSMIRAYRRKDWETARHELESCRSQAPEIVQFVYELYEQRIADLQATPPPPDWDGVYAALMK
jgi:adenylate cyclase